MTNPPAFDRLQLRQLCDLARLHVPAERQAELLGRLQRIVAAFEAVSELPPRANDQAPTLAEPPLRLRPDVVEPPLASAEVLANAPRHAAGAFVVPRVVDA